MNVISKNKKLGISIIIVVFTIVNSVFTPSLASGQDSSFIPEDFSTYSRGVYMINAETGAAVYAKSAEKHMYPASLTKLFTAAIVFEKCEDPEKELVTVPSISGMFDEIYKVGGANIALKAGETLTVKDLLYAMMIPSACDAALVLAYHFGDKSVSKFVAMMNEYAAKIGAENSHFDNPHGLQSDEHYSCPKDVLLVIERLLEVPLFKEIISCRSYVIPKTEKSAARTVRSTIEMLSSTSPDYYEYATGIKTGFTAKAGRCLSTMAEKDGATYILVMFGANLDQPPMSKTQRNLCYEDAKNLFNYMFDNYELKNVLSPENACGSVAVTNGKKEKVDVYPAESVLALVPKNGSAEIKLELPEALNAPVVPGEYGTAFVYSGGFLFGSVKLTSKDSVFASSVQETDPGSNVGEMIDRDNESAIRGVRRLFENPTFLVLILILIAFLTVFTTLIIISKKRNKSNQ